MRDAPPYPKVPIQTPTPCIVEMRGAKRFGCLAAEGTLHGVRGTLCTLFGEPPRRQLVPPTSVYRITEVTEEEARSMGSDAALPDEIYPKREKTPDQVDVDVLEIRPTLLAFAARMEKALRAWDPNTIATGERCMGIINHARLIAMEAANLDDHKAVSAACIEIAVAAALFDVHAGEANAVVTADLPRAPDSVG